MTVTDGDPAPEADEAARAARSTITASARPRSWTRSTPKKFLPLGRAGAVRWRCLKREFEEERARAEKEEGDGDDEKDAKPMSKRSKAAAEKTRREAEEKDEKDAPRPYVPTIVKSEIPVPELAYQTRLDAVEDARRTARELGAEAGKKMPSVAFYTFTHAHGFLNCATVSRDAAIVAGGFADSAVRVWDMNKAVPGGADVYETPRRAPAAGGEGRRDGAPAAERARAAARDDGGRGEAAFR